MLARPGLYSGHPERCPSGLRSALGKRVGVNRVSWVRIPPSPLMERQPARGSAPAVYADLHERQTGFSAAVAAAILLACLAGLTLPGSPRPIPSASSRSTTSPTPRSRATGSSSSTSSTRPRCPTFRERDLTDQQVIDAKVTEVKRNLDVFVDGRRIEPRVAVPPGLSYGDGQGGLPITRFELTLEAPISDPTEVRIEDGTFPDTPGLVGSAAHPARGRRCRRARERPTRRTPDRLRGDRRGKRPGQPRHHTHGGAGRRHGDRA